MRACTETSFTSRLAAWRIQMRRVPVDVADGQLLPVVDELHGSVRVQRQHGAVDLHGEVIAPAEGAADACQVDADAVRRQAERRDAWSRSTCNHCVAT